MLTSKAVDQFFASRQDALLAASRAALRQTGDDAKKMATRQLRERFKRKAGNAGVKFFPARANLPDAVIVRIKPSFLIRYEETHTVRSVKYQVIPIPPFKRVGKAGFPAKLKELRAKGRVEVIRVQDGYLVLLNKKLAYKLQREVTIQQRTNIVEESGQIAEKMPDLINSLLNAKL